VELDQGEGAVHQRRWAGQAVQQICGAFRRACLQRQRSRLRERAVPLGLRQTAGGRAQRSFEGAGSAGRVLLDQRVSQASLPFAVRHGGLGGTLVKR
jgi:hypothetical protein